MLLPGVSTFALVALATQTMAGPAPKPYQPQHARMSVRDIFGLAGRQTDGGYQPGQSFCGTGNTCAEACGAGYEQCSSGDSQIHCYDASAMQTCCPNGSGDSCDPGYYCSADTAGATFCCPDGMTLEACAAAFSVASGLTSQMPVSTSTSSYAVSSTSSTTAATTTTTTTSSVVISTTTLSTSTAVSTTSSTATSSTSTGECTTYTSEIIYTVVPTPVSTTAFTSAFTGYNTTSVSLKSTSTATVPHSTTSTTAPVQAGASSTQGSVFMAVLFAVTGLATLY